MSSITIAAGSACIAGAFLVNGVRSYLVGHKQAAYAQFGCAAVAGVVAATALYPGNTEPCPLTELRHITYQLDRGTLLGDSVRNEKEMYEGLSCDNYLPSSEMPVDDKGYVRLPLDKVFASNYVLWGIDEHQRLFLLYKEAILENGMKTMVGIFQSQVGLSSAFVKYDPIGSDPEGRLAMLY